MKLRHFFAAVAALLIAPSILAQTTFQVTIATKTAAHPYFGMGHPDAFVIDATEANELTLIRGETYTFQMNGTSAIHPFMISTDAAGGSGGAGEYTDGVTNSGASGNEALTFTVPNGAPDLLYYQCFNHQFMGWELNVINPVSIEDETPGIGFDLSVAYPNPSNDAVTVGMSLEETRDVLVEVYDVAGRRVAVLHEGALAAGTDHRFVFGEADLPGGVYLIRATADGTSVERRITLVR